MPNGGPAGACSTTAFGSIRADKATAGTNKEITEQELCYTSEQTAKVMGEEEPGTSSLPKSPN
jgi:hypothetical protein